MQRQRAHRLLARLVAREHRTQKNERALHTALSFLYRVSSVKCDKSYERYVSYRLDENKVIIRVSFQDNLMSYTVDLIIDSPIEVSHLSRNLMSYRLDIIGQTQR